MNKKISIITLGLAVLSMLFIFVAMIISTPKDNIKDIKGNRKTLENINILYQEREGIYNTKEVKISDDNIEVKRNAKTWPMFEELNETIKNNRDIFDYRYYVRDIYFDENDIGFINHIGQYYDDEGNDRFEFKIVNKNLKSKKIDKFSKKISIKGSKNRNHSNLSSIVTKYDDEIYLGVLYSEEVTNKLMKNSNEYSRENNQTIYIYKLDLDSQELESIDKFKVPSKTLVNSDAHFINDNKMYFTLVEDLNTESKINLVYYDLKEKKFNRLEKDLILKNTEDGDSQIYSIDDDKLNVLIKKDNKNKTMFYISTLDLKTGKIINKNKEYKIDKINNNSYVTKFRVIDDKIVIILNSNKTEKSDVPIKEREILDNIIVLDEKSKNILYMGQCREDKRNYDQIHILKDDEL